MTERSRFWDGVAVGDATEAPYDASTEFAAVLRSICGANGVATNLGGVFDNELNELAVSGASSPLSVASGRALAYGNWYESDAAVSVVVPTPAASTRIDRIVLRKDWTAQTVRITRIAGVEGGGAPSLVQIAGTTWDTPLAQASITTGGVITLTDQREFIPRGQAAAHQHSSSTDGGSGPLTLADANYYSWLSSDSPRIYRDAADVTALRRTTNGQALRVYRTFTDLSNYERAFISANSTEIIFGSQIAGTGVARDLIFSVGGAANIYFRLNAVSRWVMENTLGYLSPVTDNAVDLGTSSARVRTGYFGTSIVNKGDSASAANPVYAFTGALSSGLTLYGAAPTLALVRGNTAVISVDASQITLDRFTDVVGGGFRVQGSATVPTTLTANTDAIIRLWAGSNGGANDTDVQLYFYRTDTIQGVIGFDDQTTSIGGVAMAAADFKMYVAGAYRGFVDASDSGSLVWGSSIKTGASVYIAHAAAASMRLVSSPTANREVTFPDRTGSVLLGTTYRKASDESVNNSTTLQDDNDLVFTGLKSGFSYEFKITGRVTEAAADMNFKVAMVVPGGGTLQAWARVIGPIGTANAFAGVEVEMTTSGTGYTLAFANAGAATGIFEIFGYVIPSADGTLAFQWAQGSAVNSPPGLTVESGTIMELFSAGTAA